MSQTLHENSPVPGNGLVVDIDVGQHAGVGNKISWIVTPSNAAKLLGVRGAIQH